QREAMTAVAAEYDQVGLHFFRERVDFDFGAAGDQMFLAGCTEFVSQLCELRFGLLLDFVLNCREVDWHIAAVGEIHRLDDMCEVKFGAAALRQCGCLARYLLGFGGQIDCDQNVVVLAHDVLPTLYLVSVAGGCDWMLPQSCSKMP